MPSATSPGTGLAGRGGRVPPSKAAGPAPGRTTRRAGDGPGRADPAMPVPPRSADDGHARPRRRRGPRRSPMPWWPAATPGSCVCRVSSCLSMHYAADLDCQECHALRLTRVPCCPVGRRSCPGGLFQLGRRLARRSGRRRHHARAWPSGWRGFAARTAPSQGTLLPLHAKALALEDAQRQRAVVLVTLDLLGLTAAMVARIAARCSARHGLPRDRLLLFSSHTHCRPVIDDSCRSPTT